MVQPRRTGDNAGDECRLVEGYLDIANCIQQNSNHDDICTDLKTGAVDVRNVA